MTGILISLLAAPASSPGEIWIAGARPEPSGFGWADAALVAGALALAALAGLVWRYGSWLDRSQGRDLAFRALARRLGLTRADCELLARLGERSDSTHPAALLISESAFRAAQRRAERSLSLEESRRLVSIGERVFHGAC